MIQYFTKQWKYKGSQYRVLALKVISIQTEAKTGVCVEEELLAQLRDSGKRLNFERWVKANQGKTCEKGIPWYWEMAQRSAGAISS